MVVGLGRKQGGGDDLLRLALECPPNDFEHFFTIEGLLFALYADNVDATGSCFRFAESIKLPIVLVFEFTKRINSNLIYRSPLVYGWTVFVLPPHINRRHRAGM